MVRGMPPKSRPSEERKTIEALLPFWKAGKEAGCEHAQLVNFATAGLMLQPKQLEFAAACRMCDAKEGPWKIGYGGARGGGKSHVLLAQISADDCQRYPGLHVLYLRKVKKAAHENFDEFRKKICVALPHEYLQQRGMMTFKNGSRVMIGHFANDNDIDQYLGREFDLIAVEELTQLSDTKIKDILSCLRSSKPGWRPRMYANWNWGGISHAFVKNMFYEPYRDGTQTETRFIKATVYDNQILVKNNPEYIKILESFTGWKRKSWLEGSPDFSAGMYFTNWHEPTHVLKGYDESKIVRWYAGCDFGWVHPQCFLLAGEDTNGNIYILDEDCNPKTQPEEHAANYFHLLHNHHLSPHDLDNIYAGRDCFSQKEDGHTIAETYSALGLEFTPCEPDRITGFAKVMARLGDPSKNITPSLFIHARCKNLIEQIPMAQHCEKRPEDVDKMNADPETGEGGDDALDCLKGIIGSSPAGVLKFARPVPLQRLTFTGYGC
jgi:phage terminase large subunit